MLRTAMQRTAQQCNAMQRNAMHCNAMECNAMQCNATQSNFMQGIASCPSVRTKLSAPLVRTQVSASVWRGRARRLRRCLPRQPCLACSRTGQILTEMQLLAAERLAFADSAASAVSSVFQMQVWNQREGRLVSVYCRD